MSKSTPMPPVFKFQAGGYEVTIYDRYFKMEFGEGSYRDGICLTVQQTEEFDYAVILPQAVMQELVLALSVASDNVITFDNEGDVITFIVKHQGEEASVWLRLDFADAYEWDTPIERIVLAVPSQYLTLFYRILKTFNTSGRGT